MRSRRRPHNASVTKERARARVRMGKKEGSEKTRCDAWARARERERDGETEKKNNRPTNRANYCKTGKWFLNRFDCARSKGAIKKGIKSRSERGKRWCANELSRLLARAQPVSMCACELKHSARDKGVNNGRMGERREGESEKGKKTRPLFLFRGALQRVF